MPLGDVVSEIVAIAKDGSGDIRPPTGEEWVIHNLSWDNGKFNLAIRVGTTTCSFLNPQPTTEMVSDKMQGLNIHLTNSYYLQCYPFGANGVNLGYDGVKTK
jgi:hypothetical protein